MKIEKDDTQEKTKNGKFTGKFADKNGNYAEISFEEIDDNTIIVSFEEALEKSIYIWGV